MKGFLAGVAVAVLVMAAFPSLGRWVTTMPYRGLAAWGAAGGSVPTSWQGAGRGGRMAGGCQRTTPAGYWE